MAVHQLWRLLPDAPPLSESFHLFHIASIGLYSSLWQTFLLGDRRLYLDQGARVKKKTWRVQFFAVGSLSGNRRLYPDQGARDKKKLQLGFQPELFNKL